MGPLAFLWGEDTVTVTCANHPNPELNYQIQHKTIFDAEWQVSPVGSDGGETPGVSLRESEGSNLYPVYRVGQQKPSRSHSHPEPQSLGGKINKLETPSTD